MPKELTFEPEKNNTYKNNLRGHLIEVIELFFFEQSFLACHEIRHKSKGSVEEE